MKIQNRQQFLIVLTAIALALLIGNSLIYEPIVKLWKSREATVVQMRQQVSEGKLLVRREASIRSRWAQIQTNSLPNNASLAEQKVLKAFDNFARNSGVTVNSVTPQWQNDEDDYSTLDCRVEASGDLQTLTQFIYAIENDPMSLQIETIQLAARDDQGQELTLGLQVSGLALVSKTP
jgi:Tfp pilus assembly protein PilO